MSLNIKNPETHRLVRELAERTGESMTEAVTVAVRERLERVGRDFDVDEMLERIRELNRHLSPDFWTVDLDDLLYDENGLPK